MAVLGASVDLSKLEYNQAILAFKIASSNQLAKFSMVDQVIDEFVDATGIDANASTNATRTNGYYGGELSGNPTGGTTSEYTSGGITYWVNTFLSSSNYVVTGGGTVDYLVVAGGGDGGTQIGGGGGAGGLLTGSSHSVTSQTYSITVGDGGSGEYSSETGENGENSVFSSFTAIGGGGGGSYSANDNNVRSGAVGGSGGGGSGHGGGPGTGAAGTAGQGNAGTNGTYLGSYQGGGGGGVGAAASGGTGGSGTNNTIRTGSNIAYGGGGGGAIHPNYGAGGAGGSGGGGAGGSDYAHAVDGTANTGGGGGGAKAGGDPGAGGSGIVVIRTVKDSMQGYPNISLVSTTTTAEATPTTGDIVLLIEDAAGTAVLNTDVLGYISRNAGTNWSSAVTFVDEGDWGTNKRILVARDVDISSLTGTTSMRYKIATINQSETKETRIHAVSLAWG